MNKSMFRSILMLIFAGLTATGILGAATILTNSDGVIRNSLCVGFDCPNSPSFSDSTIILVENNTRIKFGDTSSTGSFPTNDWEIEANSNLNGGANYLGFNDCGTNSNQGGCATDLVFAVEAGARQSALYVESDGDVGMGTSNPVVSVHVVDGNTPTLRLEQDGSSGFTPQVWDVAGNETNFFVRDATNGSQLPFRIQPGAASNALFIASDERIGLGTTSPQGKLQLNDSSTTTSLKLFNSGSSNADHWEFNAVEAGTDHFLINKIGSGVQELRLNAGGGMTIAGSITTGGPTCGTGCDFVFDPAYEIESIEKHAEYMWNKSHLPAVGPTPENSVAVNLTEKVGGILNELEKAHIYIERLNERLKEKEAEVVQLGSQLQQKDLEMDEVMERLTQVESAVRQNR